MNCPSCNKEVIADRLFCTWCEAFIPNPKVGKKAGLGRRWFATVIDPILAVLLYLNNSRDSRGISWRRCSNRCDIHCYDRLWGILPMVFKVTVSESELITINPKGHIDKFQRVK